jgi:hypothetical protein
MRFAADYSETLEVSFWRRQMEKAAIFMFLSQLFENGDSAGMHALCEMAF